MKINYMVVMLILLATILLGGLSYVLKISFANPIEMSNDYQMTYKEVDKNYDKIIEAQKQFDTKFLVENTTSDKFSLKANSLSLRVKSVDGKEISDLNVTAIVTRPETNKFNTQLPQFKFENGQFISSTFDLPKEGRWQIIFKLSQGNAIKFINFEGFARASTSSK